MCRLERSRTGRRNALADEQRKPRRIVPETIPPKKFDPFLYGITCLARLHYKLNGTGQDRLELKLII